MVTIKIIYNPYEQKTVLYIDNHKISGIDNRLANFIADKGISEWLGPYIKRYMVWDGLLLELVKEINDDELDIIFVGPQCDFEMLRLSFENSRQALINEGYQNNWAISHAPEFEKSVLCPRLATFISNMAEFINTRGLLTAVNDIKKILEGYELLTPTQIQAQIIALDNLIEKKLGELVAVGSSEVSIWRYLKQTLSSIREAGK